MDIDRKSVISRLQKGVVGVTFTKKDGTERTMMCTLDAEVIPKDFAPKEDGEVKRVKNDEVLAVFDVEKEGWRSFRWDSVKAVG